MQNLDTVAGSEELKPEDFPEELRGGAPSMEQALGLVLEGAQQERQFFAWFHGVANLYWRRAAGAKGNLRIANYKLAAEAQGRCEFLYRFSMIMRKKKILLPLPFSFALLKLAYGRTLLMFRMAAAHRGWYGPVRAVAVYKYWFAKGRQEMIKELNARMRGL